MFSCSYIKLANTSISGCIIQYIVDVDLIVCPQVLTIWWKGTPPHEYTVSYKKKLFYTTIIKIK